TSFWTLDDGQWSPKDPSDPASVREAIEAILADLRVPTEGRIYQVERALRYGASIEETALASGVDPWFVAEVAGLVELRQEILDAPVLDEDLLRRAKHY